MIIKVQKPDSIPPQVAFRSSSPVSSPVYSPVSSPVSSYETLPGFRYVSSSQKQKLLVRKLNLCCVVFDFTDVDPTKNQREKDIKQKTLLELVDYVTTSTNGRPFTETVMQEIIKMVSENLFRTLPSPVRQPREISKAYDNIDDDFEEEEKPLLDPAWPHLEIVYELLLRFVVSSETDARFASKRYIIDHSFILRLLDLFESEDPREREYLKLIVHRIYAKFKLHRSFTRKAINNIFYRFIYENEKHNGIADLLEIVGSIIDGFVLPLKKQHKLFLVGRVLIPLHKPKRMFMYHRQLSYCITRLLQKDCNLADTVIRGLLKYWPITNSSKEVMFLGELQHILEMTNPREFQQFMVPLFRRLARCLSSSHFLVAQRTLFLWNNDHIENLIKENRRVLLPIIFPALEEKARNNWNQAVKDLTLKVRKIFSDLDHELFEECLIKCQEDEAKEEEIKATCEATWKRIDEIAASKAMSNECLVKLQEDEAKHKEIKAKHESTWKCSDEIATSKTACKEIKAKHEPTRKRLDEIVASKAASCEFVMGRCNVVPQTVERIDFRYPIPHGLLYFTQYNKPCWPGSSQVTTILSTHTSSS